VWARYAPLTFVEVEDSGPTPITVDHEYSPQGTADIRIGYTESLDGNIAHTHVPYEREGYTATGLAGDIHLWNDPVWGRAIENALAVDFFSVMLHETGHALGLLHIFGVPAVMSGNALRLEPVPQQADLLPADIEALQRLYGRGAGAVRPLDGLPTPEPASLALLLAALAAASRRIFRPGSNSAGIA
jgi:hypothetical protein